MTINLPCIAYPCDTIHRLQCPLNLFAYCCGNCKDLSPRLDLNPAGCQNQDWGHHATLTEFFASTPLRWGVEANPQKSCWRSGNRKKKDYHTVSNSYLNILKYGNDTYSWVSKNVLNLYIYIKVTIYGSFCIVSNILRLGILYHLTMSFKSHG